VCPRVNLYNFNKEKVGKCFPVPVCAIPIISLLMTLSQKSFSWIGVGEVNPKSSIAFGQIWED
jgi:hypothetical protein